MLATANGRVKLCFRFTEMSAGGRHFIKQRFSLDLRARRFRLVILIEHCSNELEALRGPPEATHTHDADPRSRRCRVILRQGESFSDAAGKAGAKGESEVRTTIAARQQALCGNEYADPKDGSGCSSSCFLENRAAAVLIPSAAAAFIVKARIFAAGFYSQARWRLGAVKPSRLRTSGVSGVGILCEWRRHATFIKSVSFSSFAELVLLSIENRAAKQIEGIAHTIPARLKHGGPAIRRTRTCSVLIVVQKYVGKCLHPHPTHTVFMGGWSLVCSEWRDCFDLFLSDMGPRVKWRSHAR